GCHALVETFNELSKYVDFRDPPGQAAARKMFACFDSRPHDRTHSADIARDQCLNMPLAMKLYSSTIAAGWQKMEFGVVPSFTAWTGDRQALNALLGSKTLRPQHKISILKLLQ